MKGKTKEQRTTSFLGQFRTDILTDKQYEKDNENKIREK